VSEGTTTRTWRRRPSPALVVASVALFFALAGTSYAAFTLGRNTVGSAQLKAGAVTAAKIKRGAVTAEKVKAGSLLASDFRAGQLSAGAPGAAGATGATGPAGPFPTTLPSGKTLTGITGAGGSASAAGAYAEGRISFAYPLASTPTVNIIAAGGPSNASCPGTLANPEAAAGQFCLYEDSPTNATVSGVGNPITDTNGGISRFGGIFNVLSVGVGQFTAGASWAVTAP
jgi:hypothetical protein